MHLEGIHRRVLPPQIGAKGAGPRQRHGFLGEVDVDLVADLQTRIPPLACGQCPATEDLDRVFIRQRRSVGLGSQLLLAPEAGPEYLGGQLRMIGSHVAPGQPPAIAAERPATEHGLTA